MFLNFRIRRELEKEEMERLNRKWSFQKGLAESKSRVPIERKEEILTRYVGVRAFGRYIMILVGIATVTIFWDILTKIIKF